MRAVIDSMLRMTPESSADREVIAKLREDMTFVNPLWARAREMGTSTKGLEPKSRFWAEDADRGSTSHFPRAMLTEEQFKEFKVYDGAFDFQERAALAGSSWQPRPGQAEAVEAVMQGLSRYPWGGVLDAPCGSGKTVMAVEVIRRFRQPTAVLVHKEFLVRQWMARLAQLVPELKVGTLRLDHVDSGKDHDVVVVMIQSLLARDYSQEWYDSFGLVVTDEVHRLGAPTWHQSITRFPARRRLGLSATVERKDGMTAVVLANLGPILHQVASERLVPRVGVRRLKTEVDRKAYFQAWSGRPNVGKLVTCLSADTTRTAGILTDVIAARDAGRKSLVLTARIEHVNTMVTALSMKGVSVARFIGGMKEADQERALEADVVVGTYPMAQEGLDCPEFDTLFLATPQSDVTQAVGRILRESPGKKHPLVVDYVDSRIGVCQGMFRTRSQTYARLGVGEGEP